MSNEVIIPEEVTKEVTTSQAELVREFTESLKAVMKPKTKNEAITNIHFLSTIGSVEKQAKADNYAFLDKRCAEGCTQHESDGGLIVKKVQNEMKKYKSTKRLKAAEKALEDAKKELEAARDEAGFTLEKGASYWKASR